MISVLVPIFNFNSCRLVEDIHRQLEQSGISYEILCYDDGSQEEWKVKNRPAAALKNVRYLELGENTGRAAIRNKLAKDARYENLLFLDCDSKIVSEDFIKKYLENCDGETVVFGGRCYDPQPPADAKKILRWKYGINRESKPAAHRRKNPYRLIFTNNFLAPGSVFLAVGLNEDVKGYGYEDSLFGSELKKRNIQVKHIDNPVCHIGLDDADVFLQKTENALSNLLLLMKNGKDVSNITIAGCYKFMNRFPLNYIFRILAKPVKEKMEKNLLSPDPSLFIFDLWRMGVLVSTAKPPS